MSHYSLDMSRPESLRAAAVAGSMIPPPCRRRIAHTNDGAKINELTQTITAAFAATVSKSAPRFHRDADTAPSLSSSNPRLARRCRTPL